MESVLKSDVFFFIATIMTVLIGLLAAFICVYIIRILRYAKEIVEKVREEADTIISDIGAIRKIAEKIIKIKPQKNGKKNTEQQEKDR